MKRRGMERLSVIVPVYGTLHTLERCIGSIAGQGVDGMEIIMVDDGATREEAHLCDTLAGKHPMARVIHKANGGLSDARNAGLGAAQGEYVTFVDSDDYLSPGTYRALVETMDATPGADMIEYPAVEREGHPSKERLLGFEDRLYPTPRRYWYATEAYTHTYACNKVFRRDVFRNVEFPKGRAFEDVHTLPAILRNCRAVATTGRGLYHYTHNPRGITATAGAKELADLLAGQMAELEEYPGRRLYAMALNTQIDLWETTHSAPVLPRRACFANCKAAVASLLGVRMACILSETLHKILWKTR